MSRRHSAEKREILPDPKFGDLDVTKLMNYVMYEGCLLYTSRCV